jgi:hypothetical protein
MKKVEQLAHNLLVRMREIDNDITANDGRDDSDDKPPTGDDYNLLWDAILDEIKAVCPNLDITKVLQEEVVTVSLVGLESDDGA